MNKITLALASITVVLAAVGVYSQWSNPSPKLAYIESGKVLNEYKEMKVAREQFQQKTVIWKGNIDTLAAEFQSGLQHYEKDKATLSKKEQELTEQLLKGKREKWMQYQQAIEKQAAEEDQKMTAEVLNKLNTFLTAYGKEKGYMFIFGANESGNVVYANEAVNITDEVIKAINE